MTNTRKTLIKFTSLLTLCATPIMLTTLTSCSEEYAHFNAKVVGHRGCPSNSSVFENTIASFEKAGQSSYYSGIECDVWPDKTNDELYVVHDEYPFYQDSKQSVTDISTVNAQTYTLHASANYPRENPGSFDHDSAFNNYKIPTLSEYLKVCIKYNKTAVIELKDTIKWKSTDAGIWTETAITKFSTTIRNSGIGDKYILISFDNELLEHIAKTSTFSLPKANMQQLYDPSLSGDLANWSNWKWIADQGWNIDVGDALSPSTLEWGAYINKDFVDYYHNKNLKVNVWTVNTIDRARALDKLGVDFLTTDWILK